MIEMLGRILRPLRAHPRLALTGLGVLGAAGVFAFVRGESAFDPSTTATVRRDNLSATLTVAGLLKPVQAITYRSPLTGRESEITFLVPEGTRVGEGDLLIRLDAVPIQRDLERANQEVRQAQVDLQVAEIDRQEGQAAIESLTGGEAALSVEETKTRLEAAERKVARLRAEQAALAPLLEKGFITRDELRRTSDELEQAEQDLALNRRRADVLAETHGAARSAEGGAAPRAERSAARKRARPPDRSAGASRVPPEPDRERQRVRAPARVRRLRGIHEREPAAEDPCRRSRHRNAGHRHRGRRRSHAGRDVGRRSRRPSRGRGSSRSCRARGAARPHVHRQGDARGNRGALVGRASDGRQALRSHRRDRSARSPAQARDDRTSGRSTRRAAWRARHPAQRGVRRTRCVGRPRRARVRRADAHGAARRIDRHRRGGRRRPQEGERVLVDATTSSSRSPTCLGDIGSASQSAKPEAWRRRCRDQGR